MGEAISCGQHSQDTAAHLQNVAMLEIFSAFYGRCCCTLCWNSQHKELLLECIWGF